MFVSSLVQVSSMETRHCTPIFCMGLNSEEEEGEEDGGGDDNGDDDDNDVDEETEKRE